jgi:putative exosortase-associated protein (TIGR04073 family)
MSQQTSSTNRIQDLLARSITAAFAIALSLSPAVAGAEEQSAARKLGRGLAGMTLGFLELPGNIVQETRTNGVVSGVTVGFAVGAGKLVVRELVGVYEFVTAPFPVPAGFEPVLQPEFSWDYFDSEPGRVYGFSNEYLSEEAYGFDRISGAVVERRAGALRVRFPEDMLFAVGSAQLTNAAASRLRDVARVLRASPDAPIAISGHTDATGDELYNRDLSLKRAVTVRNYLVRQGVAPERIEVAGYGDSIPIASNDTREGRRSNRRVDIELRASGVGAYR